MFPYSSNFAYSGNLSQLYGGFAPYGTAQLTPSSPPQSFTEPLSLDEIKAFLNIAPASPPNDEDDELLDSLIPAAREVAEGFQGKDLVRKQIDMSFDYWPGYRIELGAPLVSVDLVQYRDSTGAYHDLVANTDYIVDTSKRPGLVMPAYNKTWPSFTAWPSSAVLIRFTSGYSLTDAFWSDAGSRLKVGMQYLVSDWYEERLPFTPGMPLDDYPFKIRAFLGKGAVPRVR